MLGSVLTGKFDAVRPAYVEYLGHAPVSQQALESVGKGWQLNLFVDVSATELTFDGARRNPVSSLQLRQSATSTPGVEVQEDAEVDLIKCLESQGTGWVFVEAVLLKVGDALLTKSKNLEAIQMPSGMALLFTLENLKQDDRLFRRLIRYLPCMPFWLFDARPAPRDLTSAWIGVHAKAVGFNIFDGETHLCFTRGPA